MTTKVGYIGLNHHHCRPYLESIEQLDIRVMATADEHYTPEALGIDTLTDAPHYETPERLLDEADVDLVWITLSNRKKPAVIEAAIERGIDVFTEKPAARTAADLEPIAAAAREADVTVGVSYTWRGHPISKKLRELQRSGFFGNVRGFDLRFVASALDTRNTDHYLFDEAASRGGIVQWLGVHWLDLLPWILDDPIVRVNAQLTTGSSEIDVEDGATLQLETKSGAIGTHTCGYYLREGRYDTSIQVYGEEGQCNWDPMGKTFGFDDETTLKLSSSCEDWASSPHRQITHEYQSAAGYGGRWGIEFFNQMLQARRGEASMPATLDDALEVLYVLDAVYESASTDGWVTIERD
ncbi:Predicted dehydrogenase [Haladaptatus litoreus]|uniref:Predicted dehydrogenase n=1 Tax=Haladaptatus litoreus TaxID=553468 RepID=A0A1N7DGT4_9EURY|nr:Gfo/Idh/MocA family oxidoreductase [Haladaptatus litoreus]SIR74977.1 Predicted dehydrogenase [Haladaptatus litoreus]